MMLCGKISKIAIFSIIFIFFVDCTSDEDSNLFLSSRLEALDFIEILSNKVMEKDSEWLADHVHYPFYVSGVEIDNREFFLKNWELAFSSDICDAMKLAQCESDLFVNGEGVMVGNGLVWLDIIDGKWMVIAVNHE